MTVLVFEYICGGGMLCEELPEKLSREGVLMLTALLHDCMALPRLQIIYTLDARIQLPDDIASAENLQQITLHKDDDLQHHLQSLLHQCDAFWPIAPEFDGILTGLCDLANQTNTRLLISDIATVALFSDKLKTAVALQNQGVLTPETRPLNQNKSLLSGKRVLKPRYGAGTEDTFVLPDGETGHDWVQRQPNNEWVVQAYIEADILSISCLFKNGRSWLISCNRQQVKQQGNRLQWQGCMVNISDCDKNSLKKTASRIAESFPGLWGYVGVDLLVYADKVMVLEINPRLTTSYTGIKEALGINIAELVLKMLQVEPKPTPQVNQTIQIQVSE